MTPERRTRAQYTQYTQYMYWVDNEALARVLIHLDL